jgi:chitinase
VSLLPAGTQSFTVLITGTTNSPVNWTVQEGAVGGSITNTGFYTAPSTTGTFHVIAASPAYTATAIVTVVNLAVSPANDV